MGVAEELRTLAGAWDEWGLGGKLTELAERLEQQDVVSDEDAEAARWVREHGGLDELDRRLMPPGMEWLIEVWPRWSNGEYCRFGDWWTANRYGDREPRQLRRLVIYTPELLDEWEQGDGESYGYEWDFTRPSEVDYRPDKVEPPAPAVLAADGEPLEVGQTVWDTNGDELVVGAFEDGGHTVTCRYADVGDSIPVHGMWSPSDLTHQRPVLDADGVPIKKGETVWLEEKFRHFAGDHGHTISEGGYGLCGFEQDDALEVAGVVSSSGTVSFTRHSAWCPAKWLTHTKPEPIDSWEQWREDASFPACDYFARVCGAHDCGDCPADRHHDCELDKAKDLERRAKALAEMERGE